MGVLEPDKAREVRIDPALMKLLASDTRRNVLRNLGKRAMTLSELSRALELKKATILEHLRRLEDAELIHRRDDDRLWIYYELTPRARSIVDPVGTRLMIVLGVSVFALLVGALVGLVAQPYFASLGDDDAGSAFTVQLDEQEVSSASAFTLTGSMSTSPGEADRLQAYLLDAEQADRLQNGESWSASRQLEPQSLQDGAIRISGPQDVPPGTYRLYISDGAGGDNRDTMPILHVRPLQVDLSHTVWWRGLDDNLSVTLADLPESASGEQGRLLVTRPGDRQPLLLPLENRSVEIPHEELDRSAEGTHRLHYLYPDDERMVLLPGDFRVMDASIQVLPPILLEGDEREIHMLLHAETSARPTHVPVIVDAQALESDLVSPGRGVVRLSHAEPGEQLVQVGRQHNESIHVLPDLRLDIALEDGPRLRFTVTGANDEPRPGVQLRLDDESIGTTNHDGQLLRHSQLPQGPGLLRLTTQDEHTTAWGVTVDDWQIENRPTSLSLDNFTREELEIDVHNLEDWPVTATLVTTLDEDVIGATPVTLGGNETQRVHVRAAEVDVQGSRWAMHAEGAPLEPVRFRDETTPPAGGGGAGGGGGSDPTDYETEEPTESDAVDEPIPEAEPLFGNRIAESAIWPSGYSGFETPTENDAETPTDTADETPVDLDDEDAGGEEATPGLVAVVPIAIVLGIVLLVRLRGRR